MDVIVYQPLKPTFRVDPNKKSYNKGDFKVVYSKDYGLEFADKSDEEICDLIFAATNMTHPEGFSGHSLSVGDIVVVRDTAYICKNFGWGKVALFEGEA